MDETTREIIERITVNCDKPMTLPDGQQCRVFYDCARLTPNDLARLAATAMGDVKESSFDMIVALAYSGILFGAALAGAKHVGIIQIDGRLWGPAVRGQRVIIVDDVVFSGSRLKDGEKRIVEAGGKVVGYAAIVNRADGKTFGSVDENSSRTPLWAAFHTSMV